MAMERDCGESVDGTRSSRAMFSENDLIVSMIRNVEIVQMGSQPVGMVQSAARDAANNAGADAQHRSGQHDPIDSYSPIEVFGK